jgi:hypothetical protein
MRNANELITRLRSRLSQNRMSEADFTAAVAEILAASSDKLSGADVLLLSHALRQLEKEWRESPQRPLN